MSADAEPLARLGSSSRAEKVAWAEAESVSAVVVRQDSSLRVGKAALEEADSVPASVVCFGHSWTQETPHASMLASS